jgi:hypothetical protein
MSLLTRLNVLQADDLKHEDVPVPQWGGMVRIRVMTGAERDEFRTSIAENGETVPVGRFSAALVAATCIDEAGNRIFTMEDIEALEAKSAKSLDGPANVAMRLNGLGGKAIEEAAKNFESTQSDDSGSRSPATSVEQ